MILCDGGTSYSKVYDTKSQKLSIIPTKILVKDKNRSFDMGTGHSCKSHSKIYINELIALAQGALQIIPHQNFTILDIGSRDIKFVTFEDRKPLNMDWNSSCGGNMGFTVEVLGNYYDISFDSLKPAQKPIPVACGLLGIEKVFDQINQGSSPESSVAKFLFGMAKMSFTFSQKPKLLFLSGGFTSNLCFVQTLQKFCEVHLLGRDVLIHGLIRKSHSQQQQPLKQPNQSIQHLPQNS